MTESIFTPEFPVSDTLSERARRVSLLVLDVDGVLTDGSLYFSDDSRQVKAFHSRDGLGLKLLAGAGIEIAIITSRRSTLVADRAAELGICHLYQGREDKLEAFEELAAALSVPPLDAAFVGDDLVDLPVMTRVGLPVAVSDAHPVVRRIAHWTTPLPGGKGAVRQVCDLILFAQDRYEAAVSRFLRRG